MRVLRNRHVTLALTTRFGFKMNFCLEFTDALTVAYAPQSNVGHFTDRLAHASGMRWDRSCGMAVIYRTVELILLNPAGLLT